MNFARILEQIIGALFIGGIVLYGTVQIINTELKDIRKDIMRIEKRQELLFQDLYQPIPGRRQQGH